MLALQQCDSFLPAQGDGRGFGETRVAQFDFGAETGLLGFAFAFLLRRVFCCAVAILLQ